MTNSTTTPTAHGLVLSSSSITGTEVRNRDNKNIGEIKDLMIDCSTGEILYCVLSFGGFLGMGDKFFAVPMSAFNIDTKREEWILDVNKERLENAPGFDKNNWPQTSDNDFVNSVHSFYGTKRRTFAANPSMS